MSLEKTSTEATKETNPPERTPPETDLFTPFIENLKTHAVSFPGQRWILAVSGGLDSTVLTHLCSRLMPLYGTQTEVVHFNHQLRGREGEAEARLVRDLCVRLQLPVEVISLDVEACAVKFKLSIQEAARWLRRKHLMERAAEREAQFILTAHHATDRVEGFLMRLLRGAGTDGLAGMRYQDQPWLRPLLVFTREELHAYAATKGLRFVHDPSNDSDAYQRNRVRLQLLPRLSQFMGYDVEPVIFRTLQNLEEDAHYLSHVAELEFSRYVMRGPDEVRLPLSRLESLAPTLRRRLYQRCFAELLDGQEATSSVLERRHVEIIDNIDREHQLPLGVRVMRVRGDLIFFRPDPLKQRELPLLPTLVDVPGVTELPRYGVRCVAVTQPGTVTAQPWRSASPMNAFIDWSKIQGPVRVRRVTQKDEMQLSPGKTVNCWAALKGWSIPERMREEALVFEDAQGIIWLAPHRVDARYWISPTTRICLKLQLRPWSEKVVSSRPGTRQKGFDAEVL